MLRIFFGPWARRKERKRREKTQTETPDTLWRRIQSILHVGKSYNLGRICNKISFYSSPPFEKNLMIEGHLLRQEKDE